MLTLSQRATNDFDLTTISRLPRASVCIIISDCVRIRSLPGLSSSRREVLRRPHEPLVGNSPPASRQHPCFFVHTLVLLQTRHAIRSSVFLRVVEGDSHDRCTRGADLAGHIGGGADWSSARPSSSGPTFDTSCYCAHVPACRGRERPSIVQTETQSRMGLDVTDVEVNLLHHRPHRPIYRDRVAFPLQLLVCSNRGPLPVPKSLKTGEPSLGTYALCLMISSPMFHTTSLLNIGNIHHTIDNTLGAVLVGTFISLM